MLNDKINNNVKQNYYFTITLLFLSILFLFFKLKTGSFVFQFIGSAFTVLAFIRSEVDFSKNELKGIFFASFLIVISGVINTSAIDRNYLLYLFSFNCSVIMSLLIIKTKSEYLISLNLLRVMSFIMAGVVINLGFAPDEYNDLLAGSRNYVSGYFLIVLVWYLFSSLKYNIKPSIIYPILTFIFCAFLYGRSGILLSSIVLIIFMLQFFSKSLLSLIFVILFLVFIYYSLDIYEALNQTSFTHGFESPRTRMLFEYLGAINTVEDVLFGMEFTDCCKYIIFWKNNPHDSFIMAHSRFGIWPFLFLFSFLTYTFACKINDNKLYSSALIAVILVRYGLDHFGFFGVEDFILFTILLSPLYSSKSSLTNINSKEVVNKNVAITQHAIGGE